MEYDAVWVCMVGSVGGVYCGGVCMLWWCILSECHEGEWVVVCAMSLCCVGEEYMYTPAHLLRLRRQLPAPPLLTLCCALNEDIMML